MNGKEKIMIVDDEKSVGDVVAEILHIYDYTTFRCDNGEEALSELNRFGPDLVVTDFQMPVMDGLELTKILKKEIPDLPVVILTGRPDLVPENGLVDMVIEKPYRIEEFLKKIKELI
ncbi:MAG: response regulator [Patescibacteria group bacterium]|nr:response regulator [Patescibacteria group bacterium]